MKPFKRVQYVGKDLFRLSARRGVGERSQKIHREVWMSPIIRQVVNAHYMWRLELREEPCLGHKSFSLLAAVFVELEYLEGEVCFERIVAYAVDFARRAASKEGDYAESANSRVGRENPSGGGFCLPRGFVRNEI